MMCDVVWCGVGWYGMVWDEVLLLCGGHTFSPPIHSLRHAPLLVTFLSLECQSIFTFNYVLRIFVIAKQLKEIEKDIDNHQVRRVMVS